MGEVPGVARPQIPPELLGEAIRQNQPKNSVELPDGRRVDLAGRGHYDPKLGREIETPHVHEPRPAFKPPYDEKFPNPGVERVPRPATPKDIHDVIKHLLERLKEFLLTPVPGDKKKLDSA